MAAMLAFLVKNGDWDFLRCELNLEENKIEDSNNLVELLR